MTIKDCLNRAARERPDAIALQFKRKRTWQTTTFRELRERVWHVSEMLTRLEVPPGARVAILLDNSPEWYELYHGIVGIGAIAVPVDAKLREQEISHILHDCDVTAIFCTARLLESLADLERRLPSLRAVVVLDGDRSDLPRSGRAAFYAYDELWQEVSAAALAPQRSFDQLSPEPDAPASFIYTSGTTGRQKGAVLTHRNFMSNVESVLKALEFRNSDNVLLVLPLHHSFAFTTTLLVPLYVQCRVTLVENLKTIKSNMAETAPTILPAVPLLLDKMIRKITDEITSSMAARLLCRVGLSKVVGRKIRNELGGALRLIVSGGAPIGVATLQAWSRLGFTIVEGYGITETAPVLSVNPVDHPKIGTVGLPLDGVEIKIDHPNADGVGEIIAKGSNVMLGYHNNPEETAKVLKEGWYYTGDLGFFDRDGYLVISGRKKSLIVNREGKNIYPEEIELQACRSAYVLECLALGYREPGEDVGERVGLIAVPDQAVFDAHMDQGGAQLSDQQMEDLMREDIRKHLSGLSDYKRPRRIQIRFEEFEKTTTQKIKRYLYAIDTTKA